MEETAYLKKEIERQNQIIGILIDQIGILKSQNADYLNVITANNLNNTIAEKVNASPDFGSTIAEKGNTPPIIGSTIAEKVNASPIIGSTIAEKVNASPIIGSTIAEKGNASPIIGGTIAEKGNASPIIGGTIAEKGNVSPDIGSTIAEKGNASPDIGSTIAGKGNASPEDGNNINEKVIGPIQINRGTEGKLARALLSYYPANIKRMALESIARQLLLLSNTGKTSRMELRKISRLSTPGFKKAIPKLVRRGLVKKTGYQEYELGQLSKNIIAKTFEA